MPISTLKLQSTSELRDVLFTAMADGVLIIDMQGVIVDCNPAFHERLGYEKDELIGTSVKSLDTPEYADHVKERIKRTLSDGKATFETAHYRKDGSVMPVELSARPFEVDGQTLFFSIVRDISERKSLEADLNKSYEIYQAAINTPALGFWVTDMQGLFLEVNDAYLTQSGYSRAELLNMHIPDVEAMEKPEETAAHIEKLGRTGYDRFRSAHRRKDGSIWPVEIVVTYSKAQGGILIIFVEDIEEKVAQETRQARLIRAQRIGRIGNWEWDIPSGRLEWSDELYRMMRLDEMTFQPTYEKFLNLIHPEDRGLVQKAVQRALDDPSWAYMVEHRFVLADGAQLMVRQAGEVIRDVSGAPVAMSGVCLDITEMRRLERVAREQQAELAHVLRVQTVGEMATTLAHEINQPLATISTYAQGGLTAIERETASLGEMQGLLKKILNSAARVSQFVQELRGFLRKDEADTSPVDINGVITASLQLLGHALKEKDVTLRLNLDPAKPTTIGNKTELEQVIVNLVINGVDAAWEETKKKGQKPPSIHITTHALSDGVQITVEDSGPGIDDDLREKVFNSFFTTRPEGLGMGLPICKTIVESQGGQIWIDPAPRKGARVIVQLPSANLEESSHVP